MKEQPKDYFDEHEKPPSFDEWLRQEYEALSVFQKLLLHIQNWAFVYLPLVFAVGYYAGIYFGEFWKG